MFTKFIKGGLASAIVGIGLIAAAPQAASAGQVQAGITIYGTHGAVHIGNVKHRHKNKHATAASAVRVKPFTRPSAGVCATPALIVSASVMWWSKATSAAIV